MKKLNLIGLLFFLATITTYSEGRNIIETRVGGSLSSKFKSHIENNTEVIGENSKNGYEIVIEGVKEVYTGLYFGIGTGYQHHGLAKNIKGHEGELFNSVPFYGTMKYQLNTDGLIKPYLKADLGFSFNRTGKELRKINGKIRDTGYYGGLGIGLEVEEFILELAYQINTGRLDNKGKDYVNYSRITLGLGYRFDF